LLLEKDLAGNLPAAQRGDGKAVLAQVGEGAELAGAVVSTIQYGKGGVRSHRILLGNSRRTGSDGRQSRLAGKRGAVAISTFLLPITPSMKRIVYALSPQFFAGGVTGTLDVLYSANRIAQRDTKALFEWQLVSEDGRPVRSSTGLVLSVDGDFGLADGADVVLIPGMAFDGLPELERQIAQRRRLIDRIAHWYRSGSLIGASCTGVPLAAESGILTGQPATLSWWLNTWFKQRYPAIELQPNAIITHGERVLCSGASTSYLNLALRLVEHFAGADLAMQCARVMLVDSHRDTQAPYATLQQYAGHNDPLVTRAQQWLQDHLAEPFQLEAMAAGLSVSERTLLRRFRQVLADTPLHYLQQLRLLGARRLLENSPLGLEQIVARVGYNDVSTFRRLFKREIGCSPADYRRRFTSQQTAGKISPANRNAA